jgi:cellobiose-specific phosphotransferase system component IIA
VKLNLAFWSELVVSSLPPRKSITVVQSPPEIRTGLPARELLPKPGTPVFVHSGFRTGSTWLWNKFRQIPGVVAYYEFFHESLEKLCIVDINENCPQKWISHHPAISPYFLEFLPLITCDSGVKYYDNCMAFEWFVPTGGIDNDLSSQELNYVRNLIDSALVRGRVPVLTDCRTLGRIAGMRRVFGGQHIFLHRNLFQQWASFCFQKQRGNTYFFQTILSCLQAGGHDPFMAILCDYARSLLRGNSSSRDLRTVLAEFSNDDLFVIFVAFHVYLSMVALRHATIVLDITKLARGGIEHRQDVEARLQRAVGLPVDLSDVKDALEVPMTPIEDIVAARVKAEAFFGSASSACRANPEQIAFGMEILDNLWEEHGRSSFYARPLMQLYKQEVAALGNQIATRDDDLAQAHAEVARLLSQIEALQTAHADEIGGLRRARAEEVSRLSNQIAARDDDLAQAHAEVARLLSQIEALQSAHADEIDELRRARAEEVSTLSNQIAARDGSLAQAHAEVARLLSQIEALQTARADEIDELRRARAGEVSTLGNQIAAKDDSLTQAHAEVVRLLRQIEMLQTAHADEIDELRRARAEEASTLSNQAAARDDSLAQAHAEVVRLRGQIEALQTAHAILVEEGTETRAISDQLCLILANILEIAGGPDVVLTAALSSQYSFDEERYRKDNSDVDQAILNGAYNSGFEHWLRYGLTEKRRAFFSHHVKT